MKRFKILPSIQNLDEIFDKSANDEEEIYSINQTILFVLKEYYYN